MPVTGCQLPVFDQLNNMKSYKDLDIYRESKALAILVHKLSLSLPGFEKFEEGGQIRRSSKSITAMIVEGYGRRRYKADFIKYLVFAQSECDETMLHLDFLKETGSLTKEIDFEQIKNQYDLLSKKINRFIQWVEQNWNNH